MISKRVKNQGSVLTKTNIHPCYKSNLLRNDRKQTSKLHQKYKEDPKQTPISRLLLTVMKCVDCRILISSHSKNPNNFSIR